jgi:hypothetical protein
VEKCARITQIATSGGRGAERRSHSIFVRRTMLYRRSKLMTCTERTTGVDIRPYEVRTIPRASDPYRWKIVLEKLKLKTTENPGNAGNSEDADKILKKMLKMYEDIFKKNLSDHSINAFKALCYGVEENIIEAVPVNAVNRFGSMTSVSVVCSLK